MSEEQPDYPVPKEPRPLLGGELEAQPGGTQFSSAYKEQPGPGRLSPNYKSHIPAFL